MGVDEAGVDDTPAGIQHLVRRLGLGAHIGDDAVPDQDAGVFQQAVLIVTGDDGPCVLNQKAAHTLSSHLRGIRVRSYGQDPCMSSLHVRAKRVPPSESTAGFRSFTAGGEICEKQKTAGTEKTTSFGTGPKTCSQLLRQLVETLIRS